MLIGPLVPNADAVIVEIFDVGVAGEEPQQFVHDRLEMQLLGRRQREAFGEIETHLMPEDRDSSSAGAVTFLHAVGEDAFQQVVILAHGLAYIGVASPPYIGATRRKPIPLRGTFHRLSSLELGALTDPEGIPCVLP